MFTSSTSEYISECISECTRDYVREYICVCEYGSGYTSECTSECISEKTAAPTGYSMDYSPLLKLKIQRPIEGFSQVVRGPGPHPAWSTAAAPLAKLLPRIVDFANQTMISTSNCP